MASVEVLPQEMFTDRDQELRDLVGVSQNNFEELSVTTIHNIGNITIPGDNETRGVSRYHTGPEDTIKRGGTKFKFYEVDKLRHKDGVDHSRAMRDKIGVINETDYAGGKTIANINPRSLTPAQTISCIKQYAALMHEAGFTNPNVDGTAGDEGTNAYIDYYVEALREMGVEHPEASITGKSDMKARGPATGKGAAHVQRARMVIKGQTQARAAIQGAGAAGAHYAAEAYDPSYDGDRQQEITVPALGDLNPITWKPETLYTDHPDGLPITRKMVDAILTPPKSDGTYDDRHMQAAKGNKLAALAHKIEDKTGHTPQIADIDVLTYDKADYLVPAATSNVITSKNIKDVTIKQILEIGNHTVHDEIAPHLGSLGYELITGKVANAGGVKMSILENRRDLLRIENEAKGLYLPDTVTDEIYEANMRETMIQATKQVHHLSEKLGVNLETAADVLSIANYAIARDMQMNGDIKDLVAAA